MRSHVPAKWSIIDDATAVERGSIPFLIAHHDELWELWKRLQT
jgi:hypothetical protein